MRRNEGACLYELSQGHSRHVGKRNRDSNPQLQLGQQEPTFPSFPELVQQKRPVGAGPAGRFACMGNPCVNARGRYVSDRTAHRHHAISAQNPQSRTL